MIVKKKKLLLLHGSRQTGGLLLGRMSKLRKKLSAQLDIDIITIDAPFPHPADPLVMRQWWDRQKNTYSGLEASVELVRSAWAANDCVGLMGFSQGARFVHLLAAYFRDDVLPGLQFVLMASGYDAPRPDNILFMNDDNESSRIIDVPSLHVWGETDEIVVPSQSSAVMKHYAHPQQYIHAGGHHVPMKAESCGVYIQFIQQHLKSGDDVVLPTMSAPQPPPLSSDTPTPSLHTMDPETALLQEEEVQALQAIYPDEFVLLSSYTANDDDDSTYQHPIQYEIRIPPGDDGTPWPPVRLHVTCTPLYPMTAPPMWELRHDDDSGTVAAAAAQTTAVVLAKAFEPGMPSVLNAVYAVTEYLQSGSMLSSPPVPIVEEGEGEESIPQSPQDAEQLEDDEEEEEAPVAKVSDQQKQVCIEQGLVIANTVVGTTSELASSGGGGSWYDYTIGLVGKPSAGKSTLFNTATGFSRQQNTHAVGAAMAAHPFTTIDPNRGMCLVPAPEGSCPDCDKASTLSNSHGRDRHGRRLVPVILKDVAGLVPGAYQGRGRGNQFLNDLTDADVMLHVVDASGTADAEGNTVCCSGGLDHHHHPLQDMEWIRKELIEWVYGNLLNKWDTIQRKGRVKLMGMFSGYGQNRATTEKVLQAVECFLEENTDRTMDDVSAWDSGDVYRLVSAFLGVRFPLALALNKQDLPSSKEFIRDVVNALPIHGSLVGTPVSARSEMEFVRRHITATGTTTAENGTINKGGVAAIPPDGTLQCLQAAMSLCEPLLVFPVSDLETYAPLTGMNKHSIGDASLPSAGMIASLVSAGGTAPTMWDGTAYRASKQQKPKLRDVMLMKPGSTVEDVFNTLKRFHALSGEFIRAEATQDVGIPPKPIPKHQEVTKKTRIIKIMTNKKTTS